MYTHINSYNTIHRGTASACLSSCAPASGAIRALLHFAFCKFEFDCALFIYLSICLVCALSLCRSVPLCFALFLLRIVTFDLAIYQLEMSHLVYEEDDYNNCLYLL